MRRVKTILLAGCMSLIACIPMYGGNTNVKNLQVEYTDTPLGIDVERPRFSWQMDAGNQRGYYQTAYRIQVKDENGESVWDSGKTANSYSHHIEYNGLPLQAMTRYQWEVTIWDQEDAKASSSSWFETGLMDPDPTLKAWDGAEWIGGDENDIPFYSPYLPVFRISYTLQLGQRSTSAGFIYGANDKRLMDRNMNLFFLENGPDESWIRIELDIADMDASGTPARLHVYRAGYHPDDSPEKPFRSYDIPQEIISYSNRYSPHDFYISCVFGTTEIRINGEADENRIARINLNPVGEGGDYIAFPVVGEIGFQAQQGETATFTEVQICNYRSPQSTLYKHPETVSCSGKTEIFDPSRNGMPVLRTTFNTEKPIKKARLYATARGIYDFYINGERIGKEYFNPGLTQYNKLHLYQTYDVTKQLSQGENAMGAILGEGWWSGGATYMGHFWNFFGDRQSLLAKLVITYEDGTTSTIVTNPENWRYYNKGPVLYSSFFQGEVYDARIAARMADWSISSYNDKEWKKAGLVPLKGTISMEESDIHFNIPLANDYTGMQLTGQFGEQVWQIKELTAQSVEEIRPAVFIYDMGQNMVGVPSIQLSGIKAGTAVTIRYAEVPYPDLPEYKAHAGMLMFENIRAAMAKDIYIANGGEEVIEPRFTFHGYRYLEITGIDTPLSPENVRGRVLSSVPKLASSYETSNPLVNKLWENITWSTLGNYLSIPTDCPQRNERLGWSGDISVFAKAGSYLANMPQFLRRHMGNMRHVQRKDGRFPDVAPLGGGFGGILWGSAGITVPWESYLQYGDIRLLEEHYPAMKQYINYLLEKNFDPQTRILTQEIPGAWGNLGDWLSPEDARNDKTLLWEAYFIYDLELMSKMAHVLGKEEDAEMYKQLYEERKELFNTTYLDPVTYKTIHSGMPGHGDNRAKGELIDTQSSYILPLAFDILPEDSRGQLAANLTESIIRTNKADWGANCPTLSLMTGFIGTAWISKALSDHGYNDIAYQLFQNTAYPSWLYSVEQGATTIWERLNSYTHTDGFGGNNHMNSFNHYSFGAVAAWMYNTSLGIERDQDSPAFKHFILSPQPDPTGQMTLAKGYYDSLYGRIESSWNKTENGYEYNFTVPANTSATLILPISAIEKVKEGNRSVKELPGILYEGVKDGKVILQLTSGAYSFTTE